VYPTLVHPSLHATVVGDPVHELCYILCSVVRSASLPWP